MSFRVVAKVLRESDEKLARRLILIVLAEAASDDGIAWVGQDDLAAKAKLSRTHVTERIGEMVADGTIELRKAKRGRRRINVYRVLLPGLDEPNYDRLPFVLDEPFTTSELPTPSASTTSDPPSDDVGSTGSTASDPPTSRARDPLLEPLEDPEGTPDPRGQTPKLVKTSAGRDLGFDALAEVCGIDPRGNRAGDVQAALHGGRHRRGFIRHGIRELVALAARDRGEPVDAGPEFEIDVADEIRAKAVRYREAMPGATLSPQALAEWWTDLDSVKRRDPAAAAMETAVRLAEEGR